MRVHIIGGTGKMGHWLKLFLESQGVTVSVSGRKGIAATTLKNSDIIFISVPISQFGKILLQTAKDTGKKPLLVDMSSQKSQQEETLKSLPNPSLSIHLLFGPVVSSVQNQKVIFCRIKDDVLVNKLKELFVNAGAQVLEMTAKEHDKQMAYIQCLTHFVNISLATVLQKNKIDLAGGISTPVFLSQLGTLNRVVTQDPALLAEIQLGNPFYIKILEQLFDVQSNLKKLIEQGNLEMLTEEINAIHQSSEAFQKKKNGKNSSQQKVSIKGNVGVLGPLGTFTHQAALLVAKEKQIKPLSTIRQVFEAVSNREVAFGVVPSENSTEGTVRETLDLMLDLNLYAVASVELPIHQSLISVEKKIEDIHTIYSHPQGLAQCRNWLATNMPQAKLIASPSTVSEFGRLKKEKGVACIASDFAAKLHKLPVLQANIEDNQNNVTKFFVISRDIEAIQSKSTKTLLFLTIFNRVGILRDMLSVFADAGVNLSKIESRPSREKNWDYYFFVEVDVNRNDPKLIQALNILRHYCPRITILGGI